MENLIKSLADEVDNARDAVDKAKRARSRGQRADELRAEAEVEMFFVRIQARITELRRVMGL